MTTVAARAMAKLRWKIGRLRSIATEVGMPTLASHGPRSTTPLPNTRSTPSTPVSTADVGTSNGFRACPVGVDGVERVFGKDRKSTRLNSSHSQTSYAGFCLKEKDNP